MIVKSSVKRKISEVHFRVTSTNKPDASFMPYVVDVLFIISEKKDVVFKSKY